MLDWITSTTGILVAFSAFALIASKYYHFIFGIFKGIYNWINTGKQIEKAIAKCNQEHIEFSRIVTLALDEIKKEVKPNGGSSLNDSVRRVESKVDIMCARDALTFRHLPYPAFECDLQGRNIKVSDCYLKLLGLMVSDDLSSVNWNQFIVAEDREDYQREFRDASNTLSDFSYPARFVNYDGKDLGSWLVRASLLNKSIYSGRLFPQDDKAKITKDSLKAID